MNIANYDISEEGTAPGIFGCSNYFISPPFSYIIDFLVLYFITRYIAIYYSRFNFLSSLNLFLIQYFILPPLLNSYYSYLMPDTMTLALFLCLIFLSLEDTIR